MVEVKGWRNGLLLVLPAEGDWTSIFEGVDARLDEGRGRSFWKGAQATLDFGDRCVGDGEMSAFVDHLKESAHLVPVAVVATDPETRSAAARLALKAYDALPTVRMPDAAPVAPAAPPVPSGASIALYVPSTVRSGQRVVHDGTVVVMGDVNAGAEVIAGGDVLVLGTLRGLAHAGCQGDEAARIFAMSLRPPQLRIAGAIARAPEESDRAAAGRGPEVARIEDGAVRVLSWPIR
ncbi:MAG: septum site-determining protein MinC [Armatimonadota bacterium]